MSIAPTPDLILPPLPLLLVLLLPEAVSRTEYFTAETIDRRVDCYVADDDHQSYGTRSTVATSVFYESIRFHGL